MVRPLICWVFLFLSSFLADAQPTLGLLHTSDEVQAGYTLFSNSTETYLIDNCGLIVNQWQSEYRPGRAVYLLENGNLLRTAEQDGEFSISGRGGRFELFNWEGELLWYCIINDERQQAHHDIAPLPGGNFLCLVWERISGAEALAFGSDAGGIDLWFEAIYELKPMPNNEVDIVWEWHLKDHLIQEHDPEQANYGRVVDHPRKVNLNYREVGASASSNFVHLNSISYHPGFDQIVLSSRLFSEAWIIDHSTTSTEAATGSGGNAGFGGDLLFRFGNPSAYGQAGERFLHHQHDVQWIPAWHPLAGSMIAFNNEETADYSAVKSWQPALNGEGYILDATLGFGFSDVEVLYSHPDLYSPFMSSVQVLSDGHLLLCEADEGLFQEINGDDEVVWEYLNPVNSFGGPAAQGAEARQNQTFAVKKYGPDFPAFADKLLLAGDPVEINPDSSDCYYPVESNTSRNLSLKLLPVPTIDYLEIRLNNSAEHVMQCFDAHGRKLLHRSLMNGGTILDVSQYPRGYYVLWVTSLDGRRIVSQTFIKS